MRSPLKGVEGSDGFGVGRFGSEDGILGSSQRGEPFAGGEGGGFDVVFDVVHGLTIPLSCVTLHDLDDLVEVAADGPTVIGHPREGAMRRVCRDGRVRDGGDRACGAPDGATEAAEDDAIADVYAVHGLSIPLSGSTLHSADGILDRFFRALPVIPGVSGLGVGPAVSPLAVGDEEGQGGDSVEFFVGVGLELCGVHGLSISFRG